MLGIIPVSEITDRKSDYNECYTQAWSAFGNFQSHARDDIYSVVDNAWTRADINYMKKVMPEREIMAFNLLRRYVRLIANFEKNNRTSIRYAPVEGSDEHAAAQYTLLANDALSRGRGYHTKSECFKGGLSTGLNLFNLGMDRNHGIHFERFAYNQFILHPSFQRMDLQDCQYGILRKPITPSEAKMFFPDMDDYIDHLLKLDRNDDDKFPHMPKLKLYGRYLLNLDEWTRRTHVRKRFFIHAQQGFVRDRYGNRVEFTGSDFEIAMLQRDPLLDVIEEYERSVEVTQYLNGEEVYHGIDPFGLGDFSFTPYFGYFDPEVEHFHLKVQSAVRGLKDSQRSFDRRTIAMIRTLEAVSGSGTDFEEDTLVNPKQAYTAGNGPRFFKEGAISEGRYRDRPAPQIPPSFFQLQETFEKLSGKILNLNEDGLFGLDQKDQLLLGVVGKMRMGLGMIGMFDFFDNKSMSDQVMGMKLLRLIQTYPEDKAIRILGEPLAPTFYNKETALYDALSAETVLTDTQRNALYTEMVNLKKMGAETGDPFPATWTDILEYAPTALKHQVLRRMRMKEQQAQQQQQRAQQIEQQTREVALDNLRTDTDSERVHIGERIADRIKTEAETAQILQEMQTQPPLEALDRRIELERLRKDTTNDKTQSQ